MRSDILWVYLTTLKSFFSLQDFTENNGFQVCQCRLSNLDCIPNLCLGMNFPDCPWPCIIDSSGSDAVNQEGWIEFWSRRCHLELAEWRPELRSRGNTGMCFCAGPSIPFTSASIPSSLWVVSGLQFNLLLNWCRIHGFAGAERSRASSPAYHLIMQ